MEEEREEHRQRVCAAFLSGQRDSEGGHNGLCRGGGMVRQACGRGGTDSQGERYAGEYLMAGLTI